MYNKKRIELEMKGDGGLPVGRKKRMEVQKYTIDQETSYRLSVLKFIFMVMVVFIHSDALPELPFELEVPMYMEACKRFVTGGICATAIPGFFFISGFLLFSKNFTWIGNMKKKMRSILLPYMLINSFWILFFKIMQSMEKTAPWFSGEAYQVTGVEGVIRAFCAPIPLYYPFWFLRDLFILNIFAKALQVLMDKIPLAGLILAVGAGFNIIPLPFLVSNSSFCMFIIGYYVGRYMEDMRRLDRIRIWEAGSVFLLTIICKLYIADQAAVMLLYSLTGILFFYRLSGLIYGRTVFVKMLWCSRFSFFIFAFHEFYEAMAKKIIMMLIPQHGFVQLLEYFVLPCAVTGICIAVGAILKKYFRPLYCVLCGYREG